MKRDDDFIRQMLLDVEASDELYLVAPSYMNMTPDDQKLQQHAELLCDAGFFVATNEGVYRMTNHGHDYLAVIRSDSVWGQTKKAAAKIGGASLGIIKDIAIAYAKQEASKKLGIEL